MKHFLYSFFILWISMIGAGPLSAAEPKPVFQGGASRVFEDADTLALLRAVTANPDAFSEMMGGEAPRARRSLYSASVSSVPVEEKNSEAGRIFRIILVGKEFHQDVAYKLVLASAPAKRIEEARDWQTAPLETWDGRREFDAAMKIKFGADPGLTDRKAWHFFDTDTRDLLDSLWVKLSEVRRFTFNGRDPIVRARLELEPSPDRATYSAILRCTLEGGEAKDGEKLVIRKWKSLRADISAPYLK